MTTAKSGGGRLQGRGVLVLGGTGALGGSIVAELVGAGALVAIAGRREALVQQRAAALGAIGLVGDASEAAGARSLVAAATAALGEVHGLVNAAGAFAWTPVIDMDDDLLDRMLRANLYTTVHASRAVLPGLLARGEGFIAAVASVQAWEGGAAGVAAYAASKAALVTFLRSLQAELAGTHVRCTALFPMGVIDTPANRAAMPDADRKAWLSQAGLAGALCHALEAPPDARIFELPVYPRQC